MKTNFNVGKLRTTRVSKEINSFKTINNKYAVVYDF